MNREKGIESVIGWREWLSLPDLGIPAIKAKIDTGARTSALHTLDIEEFYAGDILYVRFTVRPLRKRTELKFSCEARVIDVRKIKNSSGQRPSRKMNFRAAEKSLRRL